ncbi:Hypothetical predicted protein [Pelobates cultripes]|uniref:Uncharacterized protein n=1 Tax=Pelobates cultripes TaxID=61616 RepID=A0AAD1SSQ8_PELCU|nr:Hypothetical predicted protein [Pelobates cultripes]
MATLEAGTITSKPQTPTQEETQPQSEQQGYEQTAPPYPDFSKLATKQDIKALLADFRQTWAADIAVIQTDLQMVTDRVHSTEEDIIDVKQAVSHMGDSLQEIGHIGGELQPPTPRVREPTTHPSPPHPPWLGEHQARASLSPKSSVGNNCSPPHSRTARCPLRVFTAPQNTKDPNQISPVGSPAQDLVATKMQNAQRHTLTLKVHSKYQRYSSQPDLQLP